MTSSLRSAPLDAPPPLLSLRGVTKTYDAGGATLRALTGVDLSIRRGELVAIMGASGSGKSTALNVLGTLDRPTAGDYVLDGETVSAMDDGALSALRNRKIGFVFQSFHLLPRDTALRNVELPMVYAGVPPKERRARALSALARVGLADRAEHRPTQLSGGQQQRVAIARSIVNEPVLLLADEPTGALDSATTKQVMALFLSLHAQGLTVVLVTHDPGVAAYAERVVTFQDGGIVSDVPNPPRPADEDADAAREVA